MPFDWNNPDIGLLGMALINARKNPNSGGLLGNYLALKQQYPNEQPQTDATATPATPATGQPGQYALPAQNPVSDTVGRLTNAIGSFESSNNYGSVGVPTRSGDRAYGRYQVMGANIPVWTKEILGRSYTPQEFLADQAAQDAVAQHKLASYVAKYGNVDDAASAWFSGRPMAHNTSRDALGTSVPAYVQNIRSLMANNRGTGGILSQFT